MAKQYDVLLRLLVLGDSGVGKTCLLCRFTDNEFNSSHISTIGVDFKMKTLQVDGIKVRVQIWDTAGQERYQTITKQYYRRAQGIILVYDITSSSSFQHILKWASDVDEFAPDKVQRILVGNKADEEQMRKVPKEQGNKSFIRLTQLVLQAHKKEMDAFQGSTNKYLDMTSLWGEQDKQDSDANSQKSCTWTTTQGYSQLNLLQSKYPQLLVVLGFPCNQFGYQENCSNGEILNSLKYEMATSLASQSFEKCDVNVTNIHPVFAYLKDKLPYPDDDPSTHPHPGSQIPHLESHQQDISWNFEKCLVGPEGEPFKRYNKKFETINMEPESQRLLRPTKT
ncbi:unnamed protein product [Coregonus sp. 'balchen']|nr:unnamed protein product [Coregonus sp. 'balchen']